MEFKTDNPAYVGDTNVWLRGRLAKYPQVKPFFDFFRMRVLPKPTGFNAPPYLVNEVPDLYVLELHEVLRVHL